MATKAPAKRKAPAPAQDSTAFGPIAERFRRAGDHERAISLCREGLKKFPNHASARVTLGWALLETGKYDEAREELEAVLRRAPDNLAAIRGLAELHDRAEHTLNLPMDGPGQWPPALEESDGHDEVARPAKAAKASAADTAKNAPAVIAPAELGLAMWSPVETESDDDVVELEAAAAAASAAAAAEAAGEAARMMPPAQVAEDAPPAETAVVFQTSHPPVASTPAPVSQSAHSGMSSMRELDPNAGVVQIQPNADAASAAAQEPVVVSQPVAPQSVVSQDVEVDLAALIAEADELDAFAEATDDIPAAIDLDSQIDLNEFNVGGVTPEPFEVGGGASQHVIVETGTVKEEPPAAAMHAEQFEVAAPAPAGEIAPEPVARVASEPTVELAPEPVVELALEPVVELAPEPVVEVAPEPVAEVAPEPAAAVAPEPVVELAPEPVVALTPQPAVELAPEAVAEHVVESAAEPVREPAAELAAEPPASEPTVELEPIAAFEAIAPVDAVAATPVIKPQVAALERFLRQVQTRRLVLVAESVA